jgi:NAD(P)-dependent dehydrogenase (short-subunit alcohol dehydrogenase family)
MSKLAGKNILITGASQGLGREMALRFAREGAAGLSIVARHVDELNKVREEIRQIAPKIDIVAIEADVSKPRDIERIVATTLAQFKGRLDVLVNNASTIGPSPMPNLLDYPVEDFREGLHEFDRALLIKTRCQRPECGGSIINVTSDAGRRLSRVGSLRHFKFRPQTYLELEDSGVRVNWVDLGHGNTAMHRGRTEEDQVMGEPIGFFDLSGVR